MIIQKINGTYLVDQDRILLRMSSCEHEEFRLWITRRTCLDLLTKITENSVKSVEKTHNVLPNSAKVIDQFNQETLSEKLDFQVPFEPKNKLPLGHEPILIKEIGWHTLPDLPDGSCNITWGLINGKAVNTPLNAFKLNALRLLIEKLILEANWDHTNKPPVQVVNQPQTVVH
jgi:hypothetical protein